MYISEQSLVGIIMPLIKTQDRSLHEFDYQWLVIMGKDGMAIVRGSISLIGKKGLCASQKHRLGAKVSTRSTPTWQFLTSLGEVQSAIKVDQFDCLSAHPPAILAYYLYSAVLVLRSKHHGACARWDWTQERPIPFLQGKGGKKPNPGSSCWNVLMDAICSHFLQLIILC